MRGRKKFHFSVSITCSLSTTLYFHLLQNGTEWRRRPAKCITLCLKWFVFWRCHAQEASKWHAKKDRQLHGYSICQLVTKYDISQVPTKSCNNEDAWEQLLKMEKNVHFICLQFNRIYSQKEIAIWFCSDRVSKFEEKRCWCLSTSARCIRKLSTERQSFNAVLLLFNVQSQEKKLYAIYLLVISNEPS